MRPRPQFTWALAADGMDPTAPDGDMDMDVDMDMDMDTDTVVGVIMADGADTAPVGVMGDGAIVDGTDNLRRIARRSFRFCCLSLAAN